jgi:PST family polysaccharide transporter
LEFSPRHYREIFSFGSKVIVSRIIQYFIRYTDTLLIGYFLGTSPLGIYSFAQKIFVTLTDLVDLTFNKVTFSVFSKLQDQKTELANNFYKFINMTAVVSFPLFVATFVFSPSMVPILFGNKWIDSVPIIQILSLAGVAACLYSCFNNLLSGIGKVGLSVRIRLGYLAVIVLLMYLAVQISTEMVAIAYVMSILFTLLVALFYVRQFIGLPIKSFLLSLAQPFLTSIGIAALVYGSSLLKEVTPLVLVLQIVASVALYIVFIATARPKLVAELKLSFKKKTP